MSAVSLRVNMACVGEDDEPSGDPFSALEQGQGMGEDVVAVFSGEQRQANWGGKRGLEVEGEGCGDCRVEDVARRRLKTVAVQHARLGIERGPIEHLRGPAGVPSPAPSGRTAVRSPMPLSSDLEPPCWQSEIDWFSAVARGPAPVSPPGSGCRR